MSSNMFVTLSGAHKKQEFQKRFPIYIFSRQQNLPFFIKLMSVRIFLAIVQIRFLIYTTIVHIATSLNLIKAMNIFSSEHTDKDPY